MQLMIRTAPSCCCQRRPHRGFTLIELVTVLTVSSILISILTALVVQMSRLEVNTRDRISDSLAIARFSDHFRADVHGATDVRLLAESDDGPSKLVALFQDAVEVQYRQSGQGIDRVMQQGDQIIARDRYGLPKNVRAKWSQQTIDPAQCVRVDLIVDPANRPLFSIVAQVGRHQRAASSPVSAVNDEPREQAELQHDDK